MMKKLDPPITLEESMRLMPPRPAPQTQAAFDAELDAAAREITGHGPGHPDYDAIVNPPPLGRPKGGKRDVRQVGLRLPVAVLDAVKKAAKRRHIGVADALREAAVLWVTGQRP